MNEKLKTLGSAGLLLAVVVGLLIGAAGGAVGQTTGVSVANDTLSIDNDTRSVYADVAAGNNSSVTLDVTFRSVDESGNLTSDVNETRTVSLNASEEQLVDRSSLNTSAYDSVRVMVNAQNVNSTNATAETGKVQEIAGGSGGFSLGGEGGMGIGVIVVAGGAALLLLRGRGDE